MRKYLLLYFSILFSLLMAHQACAQNSIEVETESTENFVSIRVDGITRLVFDFDSERVYNYDADGANDGSMALNDVVWGVSGGSSYAFSQRKSAISALTTATGALQIKHSQIPYDPYPCDLGPCPHGYTPPANPWGPLIPFDNGELHPWMGQIDEGLPNELEAYDEYQWGRWRDEQCDTVDSLNTWLTLAGTGGGSIGTCYAALQTGGVAWPACALIAASYLAAVAERNEAIENCNSSYPGFKEW